MSNRRIFIIGLLLTLFPFIAIFAEWKEWIAFAIGLYLIAYALFVSIRQKSSKKDS